MIYASVVVVLKNGRYHANTWTDFGNNPTAVEKRAREKFADKNVFGLCVSPSKEAVKSWTDDILKKNVEIEAAIKAKNAVIQAQMVKNHEAKLAAKKPKMKKGISTKSYGAWMAERHQPAIKKKPSK